MHCPFNGPRLALSHSSPASTAPLPHFGFGWHLDVSKKQFGAQLNCPDAKPKSVHALAEPKSPSSQCSPVCIILSPQYGCLMQFVVSI